MRAQAGFESWARTRVASAGVIALAWAGCGGGEADLERRSAPIHAARRRRRGGAGVAGRPRRRGRRGGEGTGDVRKRIRQQGPDRARWRARRADHVVPNRLESRSPSPRSRSCRPPPRARSTWTGRSWTTSPGSTSRSPLTGSPPSRLASSSRTRAVCTTIWSCRRRQTSSRTPRWPASPWAATPTSATCSRRPGPSSRTRTPVTCWPVFSPRRSRPCPIEPSCTIACWPRSAWTARSSCRRR